jgi:hypothetical protein
MKRVSSTNNEYMAEDWKQNMFEASRSKIWWQYHQSSVINITFICFTLGLLSIINAQQQSGNNDKTILRVNTIWDKAVMSWHVCKNWDKHEKPQSA